jgi:hypothetical protein
LDERKDGERSMEKERTEMKRNGGLLSDTPGLEWLRVEYWLLFCNKYLLISLLRFQYLRL